MPTDTLKIKNDDIASWFNSLRPQEQDEWLADVLGYTDVEVLGSVWWTGLSSDKMYLEIDYEY